MGDAPAERTGREGRSALSEKRSINVYRVRPKSANHFSPDVVTFSTYRAVSERC